MGNEESLVGFPVKQVVPALVSKLFSIWHKSSGSVVNKANSLMLYHEVETWLYTNFTHKWY